MLLPTEQEEDGFATGTVLRLKTGGGCRFRGTPLRKRVAGLPAGSMPLHEWQPCRVRSVIAADGGSRKGNTKSVAGVTENNIRRDLADTIQFTVVSKA